ncbi:hypothetical protein [Bradyrhizobium canariense]|uniref:hypothetical protein n=1 Tax=Bradyrhizobium canariense TaxID=255045 RepID=UPI000A18F699|nr:hypothetical protein [Bradyrhizobium canariense]
MATEKKASTVPANPAMVEFPRDEWGFTTELRKAGLQAASRIRGNDEKHKLFIDTIKIIAQHAIARLEGDAAALVAEIEQIAERDASALHRQFGITVAPAAEEKPAE